MLESSSHIRLLFIEDDERLAKFTADYLTERALVVTHVSNGAAGLRELVRHHHDIVLLDVMLPGEDGFAVCKAIREKSDIPVLLLTARSEEPDRVLGLELGADDYLVKPVSPRELLARLRAFVRRHRGDLAPKVEVLVAGALTLDESTLIAALDGVRIPLTPLEIKLLARLMERRGRVLTREHLLDLLKGGADETFDRAIDTQISRLRLKLGHRGHELIRTIRGVGYMLAVEET